MKVLVIDLEGEATGLDLAFRAKLADHAVRYWLPPSPRGELTYGEGMVQRVDDWEPNMNWADLIVLTGNSRYQARLAPYFGMGYPIFGAPAKAAELELDREKGQQVMEASGIETLPYTVVDSAADGIEHIARTGKAFVMKPWGGEGNKALTHVSHTPDEGIFILEKWEREGIFQGQLMLQEKVDGIEIGVSGMFGPGGWCRMIEESFEHKKLMNDDLGENTGEMGTVIRHTDKSRLFDMLLRPLTAHLLQCRYVGDCSINCIVDEKGTPWPLEFTMRLGWPDFCIRQEVLQGDPVEWMLALVQGKDEFEVSTDVALGVVMAHGDFPRGGDPQGTWEGYPIEGITPANRDHIHWQMVKRGPAPRLYDGRIEHHRQIVTAGNYVAVVTGSGSDVKSAHGAAYAVADALTWPSNVMYRTDIGDRLAKELPILHKLGYAVGMEF